MDNPDAGNGSLRTDGTIGTHPTSDEPAANTPGSDRAAPPTARRAPGPDGDRERDWTGVVAPRGELPPGSMRTRATAMSLLFGLVAVTAGWFGVLTPWSVAVGGIGAAAGIVGLFGPRRVSAVVGVLLGVTAMILGVRSVDQQLPAAAGPVVDDEFAPPAPVSLPTVAVPASPDGAGSATVGWGGQRDWPDGVSIGLSAPRECTPSGTALPQHIVRAVRFTMTITNGSSESLDTGALMALLQPEFDGRAASPVLDSAGDCGDGAMGGTALTPGEQNTVQVAYAVDAQPGRMTLTITPTVTDAPVTFTGTA